MVIGAQNPPNFTPDAVESTVRAEVREACLRGLKGPSGIIYPSLHCPQKAAQAAANMAASNVFVSRKCFLRHSNST